MENRGILCARAHNILQFDTSFWKKCLISRGSCKNGISDVAYKKKHNSVLAYLFSMISKKNEERD